MVRVKFLENFKDGNVLGGQFFKVGQVEVISDTDKEKVLRSGGLLEVIEMVIPNPLKRHDEPKQEEPKEEPKEEPRAEVKRKAGRPRKNEASL